MTRHMAFVLYGTEWCMLHIEVLGLTVSVRFSHPMMYIAAGYATPDGQRQRCTCATAVLSAASWIANEQQAAG
jgi:hypothetical protein